MISYPIVQLYKYVYNIYTANVCSLKVFSHMIMSSFFTRTRWANLALGFTAKIGNHAEAGKIQKNSIFGKANVKVDKMYESWWKLLNWVKLVKIDKAYPFHNKLAREE